MGSRFSLFVGTITACSTLIRADPVSVEQVEEALNRAITTMHSQFSVEGGYASRWTLSTGEGQSEHRSSRTVISIQPPGTTSLGPAFLRAYQITKSPEALKAARDAALCLTRCQLSSGGWDSDFDFDPEYAERYHLALQVFNGDTIPGKRRHRSTLDDNKTQSALLFLLEYVDSIDDSPPVKKALDFGLDSLLAAQDPSGGWPQKFDGPAREKGEIVSAAIPKNWPRVWPDQSYSSYLTLNDGNLYHIAQLLLRAHETRGEERYHEAAIRLGDFLLHAQLPEPQRGWAQQYNLQMEPVWARKFEPPALASTETYSALETLYELWVGTGEARFRAAIPEALDWLKTSRLKDGSWARFYELGTNRPLYCTAETYELTYDDNQLPTHYGFQISSRFEKKIERIESALDWSLEQTRARRSGEKTPDSWKKRRRDLEEDVSRTLSELGPEGIWTEDNSADAKRWTKNLNLLCDYLEAAASSEPHPKEN